MLKSAVTTVLKDILQHFKFENWRIQNSLFDVTNRLSIETCNSEKNKTNFVKEFSRFTIQDWFLTYDEPVYVLPFLHIT